jgi:hypothetical protein
LIYGKLICSDLGGKATHLEAVQRKCVAYLWTARWFFIMVISIQKVVDICVKDILVDWHPALGLGEISTL